MPRCELDLTIGVPAAQEELFAGLNCQPGFVCSRSELSQDLRSLLQSGLFANVDARVQHKGKGKYTLEFTFSENLWQPIKSFKVCLASAANIQRPINSHSVVFTTTVSVLQKPLHTIMHSLSTVVHVA